MRSFSLILALVAACSATCLVAQQSLVPFQGQVIAFTPNPVDSAAGLGDLAPGCGGDKFGSTTFGSAVIDGNGRAIFRAKLVSNSGTVLPLVSQFGYFYGDSRGSLVKVLRGGDPEPSSTYAGAIVSNSTGGNGLSTEPPRISDNGFMMFTATIAGGSITTANDTVLYYGTPGSFTIVAQEGNAAPGFGGALYPTFGGLSTQQSGLNSAGWAIFQASLANDATSTPPVTSSNNLGFFRRDPFGTVSLIVREGDFAPTAGLEQLGGSYGFTYQMNSTGTVVTDVGYVVGSGTPAVTTANDKAIWIIDAAGTKSVLVREGDANLQIPGTNYANASNSWNITTGSSTFNSSAQLLNWTPLTGAVTLNVDDGALMLMSLAGNVVVYRRGDLAPGVQGVNPGATLGVPNGSSLSLNDSGRVCFTTVMTGGGITTTNDTAIFTGPAGNLALVAREGDVAPNTGGLLFGNIGGVTVHMNALGQLVFPNTLSNGDSSVWSWDPTAGLQCLTRNGDSIQVQPAIYRTSVGQTGSVQFSNNDGRPLFFANDGTVAFRVSMTDAATLSGSSFASSAIVSVRIGSFTSLPNRIPEATGATVNHYVNAGLAHAGQLYAIGGSLSGTSPGLAVGAFTIPLNYDWYTQFTIDFFNAPPYFVNTLGLLDADGRGVGQFIIPPVPGLAGTVVNHAYAVLDNVGNVVFASEPSTITIVP